MHDDVLQVDVSHVDGITWVTVDGEIDLDSAVALRAPLEKLDRDSHVLVDMADVRFMDSTGVNVLITQHLRMSEHGGSIHISNPSDPVRRLIEVTGLTEILLESAAEATH